MITGGCLCGGVRFELDEAAGPFELCHCSRCRKVSGSAYLAMVGVRTAHYRLRRGAEQIACYEAPVLEAGPPYRASFCRVCGSPVPNPDPGAAWFELPAGLLDDDPGLRPDKHIFVDRKAPWHDITDSLPRLDKHQLTALRAATSRAEARTKTPPGLRHRPRSR
jgi:hypothetical protein